MNTIEKYNFERCPECGRQSINLSVKEHRFEYSSPKAHAWLSATLPVFKCIKCKFDWIDEGGRLLIEHAITKYLEKANNETISSC